MHGLLAASTTGLIAFVIIAILVFYVLWISNAIVRIPNDKTAVVEKLWAAKGSVKSGFMALNNEAGFRPEILRGGVHFLVPYQYRVHKTSLVTIPQGTIGYVFARGGKPLAQGQVLAHCPPDVTFEDARAFIMQGGQRGLSRTILRAGVWAINLAQFVVFSADQTYSVKLGGDDEKLIAEMRKQIEARNGFFPTVIRDGEDLLGVVTIHDGPTINHGDLFAPTVGTDPSDVKTFHNSFQDPDAFLAAGGRRGRQEMCVLEGTYLHNCLFATIEYLPKQRISIGKVGVVNSFTGAKGDDLSAADYHHGELVEPGKKGVWSTALQPGKYAYNPYVYEVTEVPTTNFVLKWVKNQAEDHGFDDNLAEIRLVTSDGFKPLLPISIVVHIAPDAAPAVVQQFADIKRLVDQTIDPMVSSFFKNTAQSMKLMDLINQRTELQARATAAMREAFTKYNLSVQEVMIGTLKAEPDDHSIDSMLKLLQERQAAEVAKQTFITQTETAIQQRALKEAEANAAAQSDLTRSNIEIEIAENQGKANLARARQDAESVKIAAAAAALQVQVSGEAEAGKITAIGNANASALKAQVDAFGKENTIIKEVATILGHAIVSSPNAVVPQVMVGASGGNGNVVELLTGLLARNLGGNTIGSASSYHAPVTELTPAAA